MVARGFALEDPFQALALDRLIAEDRSAVLEGVPLLPGALPRRYFESADIVWMTLAVGVCISEFFVGSYRKLIKFY